MVCPNCQKSDVEETANICPRCGWELAHLRKLTDQERSHLIEKSILKGNIAEYQSREKNYKKQISQLKSYVILLLFLLPISRCVCTKKPLEPTLTESASATLYNISQKQLQNANAMLEKLTATDSTFMYIVLRDDYIQNISRIFYNTTAYSDTIINDNYITNTRRIRINDTLILRVNPKHYIPNITEIKEEKIRLMREGKGVK